MEMFTGNPFGILLSSILSFVLELGSSFRGSKAAVAAAAELAATAEPPAEVLAVAAPAAEGDEAGVELAIVVFAAELAGGVAGVVCLVFTGADFPAGAALAPDFAEADGAVVGTPAVLGATGVVAGALDVAGDVDDGVVFAASGGDENPCCT